MSEEQGPEGTMRVDTSLIRQLAELLAENDLSEIEVEDGERRIVVKRKLPAAAAPAVYAAAPPAAPAPTLSAPAAAEPAGESGGVHPGAVKSPMVGTVYLSPEPGAAPFVAPGMRVEAGDTLLIIEAMKVMNPITAPRSGTIKQLCVQDAEPVEFDQALVIIE